MLEIAEASLGRGSLTHQQVSTGFAASSINIKCPAMPPKINGSTMADLVEQAVQKEVTSQLNEMQEQLKAS